SPVKGLRAALFRGQDNAAYLRLQQASGLSMILVEEVPKSFDPLPDLARGRQHDGQLGVAQVLAFSARLLQAGLPLSDGATDALKLHSPARRKFHETFDLGR